MQPAASCWPGMQLCELITGTTSCFACRQHTRAADLAGSGGGPQRMRQGRSHPPACRCRSRQPGGCSSAAQGVPVALLVRTCLGSSFAGCKYAPACGLASLRVLRARAHTHTHTHTHTLRRCCGLHLQAAGGQTWLLHMCLCRARKEFIFSVTAGSWRQSNAALACRQEQTQT